MLQFSFYLGLVSEVLVTSSGAKWGHVALYCLCRELIQLALGRTPKDLIAGRIAVLFPYPISRSASGTWTAILRGEMASWRVALR